jgi:hypothetical protein
MSKRKKAGPIVTTEEALASVRAFLEELNARGDALSWPEGNIPMSAKGAKVLAFTRAVRHRYYRCLTALGRATYHIGIGEESLRKAFDDAIFAALDGPADQFEERCEVAIKALRVTLLSTPEKWRIAYRIQWIEPTELPFTYRDVLFVKPEKALLKDAIGLPASHAKLDEHVEEFLREMREGVGVSVTEVEACDEASARALALDRVYSAVDELTGFSAVVYNYSTPVVADVFNALRVSLATFAVTVDRDVAWIRFPIPLPFDIVRPGSLFSTLSKTVPATRIASLLGTAPDDEMSDRIRACARYLGRAQQCTFQDRSDDAFLYLIVALESLFGRKDFRDAISYQLRMRIAHLIGQDLEERKDIEREVVRLYDVRSQLVHLGIRQVRAFDVAQARSYAVRCLSSVLLSEPANSFAKFSELEEWYRDKLLT